MHRCLATDAKQARAQASAARTNFPGAATGRCRPPGPWCAGTAQGSLAGRVGPGPSVAPEAARQFGRGELVHQVAKVQHFVQTVRKLATRQAWR